MHARTALALASGFLTAGCLTGCIVPPHDSFATPEDTVLTFQSAFARGDEFKEYDCFATRLKRETGLDQQKWSVAREEVFRPIGSIGRFVLRRNSLEDNLVGGKREPRATTLVYEMFGFGLEVVLEPEAVFVLPKEGGGELVFPIDESSGFVVAGGGTGSAQLTVLIEAARDVAARLESEGAPWAELRNQWKVIAVAPRPEDAPPAQELPRPPEKRQKTVKTERIAPVRLGESLGVVKLQIELSLDLGGCVDLHPIPPTPDRWRWEVSPHADL